MCPDDSLGTQWFFLPHGIEMGQGSSTSALRQHVDGRRNMKMAFQIFSTRMVNLVSVLLVLGASVAFALRGIVTVFPDESRTIPDADDRGQATLRTDGISPPEFWGLVTSGQRLGPQDAAVNIVVFSDYGCGFCVQMNETLGHLLERYPQHVSVVVKHLAEVSFRPRFNVPLGALCAGEQNRFHEYHDASFESGRRIEYTTGWRDIANTAGIPDLEEFESCVRSRRLVSKIEQDTTDAARLGVRVAPTLFINGERVIGTAPLEVLDSIVASNFVDRRVSSRS